MAYTIIDVERKTGISSHTLRFWVKKGLFPFIERNKNGVKYFSQRDVGWVEWIACLRSIGMSIKDIKTYITLSAQGIKTAESRQEMLIKQRDIIQSHIKDLNKSLKKLQSKIETYDEIIKTGIDFFNPESSDYKA